MKENYGTALTKSEMKKVIGGTAVIGTCKFSGSCASYPAIGYIEDDPASANTAQGIADNYCANNPEYMNCCSDVDCPGAD